MTDRQPSEGLLSQLLEQVSGRSVPAPMITGVAGGGAVSVEMEGFERVVSVFVSPEALDDAEILGDLIAAAVNDALAQARAQSMEAVGSLLGGIGILEHSAGSSD